MTHEHFPEAHADLASPEAGKTIHAGIVGSGYTAQELIKILKRHPQAAITALNSRQSNPLAGQEDMLEGLAVRYENLPPEELARRCDVAFLCIEDDAAQKQIPAIIKAGTKCIDLGGSYRLRTPGEAKHWYGTTDEATLEQAVYGLPELYRDRIRRALFVANPGCYPTASILAAVPALHLQDTEQAIGISAVSGYSGAGGKYLPRGGWRPYKVAEHRHRLEIGEVLGDQLGQHGARGAGVTFTPHINDDVFRGMEAMVELRPSDKIVEEEVRELYRQRYAKEPFVQWIEGEPDPSDVVGTNVCRVAVWVQANVIKVISVIDNLGKGSSSQAVQNMNLMFGIPETAGLHD